MDNFIQALIMSFREGLEAFLIITVLLNFLEKVERQDLKKEVWKGVGYGFFISFVFGFLLLKVASFIADLDTTAKLWESIAGFIAVLIVTTFIAWMMRHGSQIVQEIEHAASLRLEKGGIVLLTLLMVAREGVEVSFFSFAGQFTIAPVVLGLAMAAFLVLMINYSLLKVNLKTIFILTLAYLVLQAGYLLGYSIHEGLSAAKGMGWLSAENLIYAKAFNLSDTILNHKQGLLGLPMNVLIGWYSKPEWIQATVHYGYLLVAFAYWVKISGDSKQL